MRKINVLSLFDGISCGQLALQRANILVHKYFASEIDKYAIKVTQYHFPNTIQLYDITKINVSNLPKIDLLIGGSPCQGFSFAGKQLNFNDPRSKLFFEYVRIKNELEKRNPKLLFILENVIMKRKSKETISKFLDILPIEINSNLVSAQNRRRLYWTNIKYKTNSFSRWSSIKNKQRISSIDQPQNKKIFLKDILENDQDNIKKEIYPDWKLKKLKNHEYKYKSTYKILNKNQSKCNTLVSNPGSVKQKINIQEKFTTLTAQSGINDTTKNFCSIIDKDKIRYLTLKEWERLQTLPEDYTIMIPKGKRYNCIGNGWTIDVISHIFSYLKDHPNIVNSILRK